LEDFGVVKGGVGEETVVGGDCCEDSDLEHAEEVEER
jgi:hypothetical protein